MFTIQGAKIDYTNWRGVRGERIIVPSMPVFEATEWHQIPCWQLKAWDVEKKAWRSFAIQDIHSWQDVELEMDEDILAMMTKVIKTSSYAFDGYVRGICWTAAGKDRYVVEMDDRHGNPSGLLHIFSATQLASVGRNTEPTVES